MTGEGRTFCEKSWLVSAASLGFMPPTSLQQQKGKARVQKNDSCCTCSCLYRRAFLWFLFSQHQENPSLKQGHENQAGIISHETIL